MTESPDHPTPPARLGESYWAQSRRPLTSLAFTAPLLVIYETGIAILREDAFRNGAEVWMRNRLGQLGFGQYFLLPLLTVCLLLGWHYLSREPWRVSRRVLYVMAGECALLAPGLWLILYLQSVMLGGLRMSIQENIQEKLGKVVGYLGAGIYEELLFRLILLTGVIGLLAWLRAGPRASTLSGILITSLLFAGAHYLYIQFDWFSFIFRVLAGIFFAVLFLYRGFGIAAGTHAGYDVLIALTSRGGC
ncbi:MAG: CPBP family intramembrane glutamic endopeptidase [Thermoguttaceae bacterium]|jgi:membrane protease YdiL (CAAX protease family)